MNKPQVRNEGVTPEQLAAPGPGEPVTKVAPTPPEQRESVAAASKGKAKQAAAAAANLPAKEGTIMLRARCRVVRALVDNFPGDQFRKAGEVWELWGDAEINPEVIEVLTDTPPQYATVAKTPPPA